MQVCKKWGHILVDISLHQGRLFVVSYNMKCYILNVEMYIYCFILLFHRAGKPPPGLHLDCMKDGKMIQVIKYLKHMIVHSMYMHLDSGVAMWHTHAVLFHECYTNTMEYQHNLYFKIFQCAIKTSDNSRNLESVQNVCF